MTLRLGRNERGNTRVTIISEKERPVYCIREVGATAPRTLQAFWDEVVRRWPAMADEIVADPTCARRLGHVLDALTEAAGEA